MAMMLQVRFPGTTFTGPGIETAVVVCVSLSFRVIELVSLQKLLHNHMSTPTQTFRLFGRRVYNKRARSLQ